MLSNSILPLKTVLGSRLQQFKSIPKLVLLFSLFSSFFSTTAFGQSSTCGYKIKLESVTYRNNQTTLVYSVQNPRPGNGKNGTLQDVSHFGFVLADCIPLNGVKSNGKYGIDKSQNCYTRAYLKFDYGTKGSAKTFYTVTLNGIYARGGTTLAIIKSGSRTPCCTVEIEGVRCEPCVPPACDIQGNPHICNDGSTINAATLTATGGVSYSWTGPSGFTPSTNATITTPIPGIYTVRVTDAAGCTNTCTKEVTVSNKPTCRITGNTEVCFDGSTPGSTTLTASGGDTYLWEFPDGRTSTNATITIATTLHPQGVYKVTVFKNGCSSSCEVNVVYKNCSSTSRSAAGKSAEKETNLAANANTAEKLSVKTSPNPFQNRVRFVIQSKESGQAVLEVYNMAGARIKTVYQGFIEAGRDQIVEYDAKGAPKGNLVYRLQVGKHQVSGKLISAK